MKFQGRIKIAGKRQVTLPAEMCRDLGIQDGDFLDVERVDGEIRLRRAPRFPVLQPDDPVFGLIGAFGGSGGGRAAEDHDGWVADEAGGDRGP